MLEMKCHITISDPAGQRDALVFTYAKDVTIDKSWKNLTDTCHIKLPRNIKLVDKRLDEIIKNGDKIVVKLGYGDTLYTEFEGYIKTIKPTIPLELDCEDEMYNLKKGSITKSWKSVSLNDVLSYIYPDGKIKVIGKFDPVPFTINKATPAQVLAYITKTYGLHNFFRNGVLCVGNVYDIDTQQTYKYHFQKNIRPGHSLEYKHASDFKIKVKATNMFLKDNRKEEYQAGDADGEERTLHYYNETTANFHKFVDLAISKLKYDGYRGSFTGWGLPPTQHGDIVDLDGVNHQLSFGEEVVSDNRGKYYVDQVKITWNNRGYRREIFLGPKQEDALTAV